MKPLRLLVPLVLLVSCTAALAADKDPTRIYEPGKKPDDARLGKPRHLDLKDFNFTPPADLKTWEARRKQLREQVLVAEGLWPMPEKTPLNPVVHGKVERDDYTIEKVFFASMPGHYVSGNLYRPKGKTGKLPGVLFPHGHWQDARFFDAGEKEGQKVIDAGGDKWMAGARHPLQALPVQLARMGCVVFHYDMVGHSDSKDIPHPTDKTLGQLEPFVGADAQLQLHSIMGLQTWNSIRALDFLCGLPDVDTKRIGVTGASGGGTQTFILCAVDDRPTVAFPAVMVSTAMQGGCVCENCSYLRIGTGNVEIAALFAPKPLGMTGANDWTVDIEKKGLPELKALYKLYGAEDKVMAKCFPQFGHNYNQVSREVMYNWFNKHLDLGLKEPVTERDFKPATRQEQSVYNEEHPHPKDAVDAERLRQYMTEASDKQINALMPKEAKSLAEFKRVFGTALHVMVADQLPEASEVLATRLTDKDTVKEGWDRTYLLGRKGQREAVPFVGLRGKEFDGTVVVWVHPEGKSSLFKDGKLVPAAQKILDAKGAIYAIDVLGTGELTPEQPFEVNDKFSGYTFGYNRPLLANRVHDILTVVAYAKGNGEVKKVHLVGFEKAGPCVLLARGLCGDVVARTAADWNEFRFDKVRTTKDEMMLPGALKYGNLSALAALAAPGELFIHNNRGSGAGRWLKAAYEAAGAADKRKANGDKATPEAVVEWLMR
jgi:dienelactone hydrolase